MNLKHITEAVRNLTEELITPEIVTAALAEGQIELLNYLPEKYLTESNINILVENDKSYWGHFDLQRIPEQYRNQAVCHCAVKKHKDNYRHVPDELKTAAMLEELTGSVNHYFHLLEFVPPTHWTVEAVYKGVNVLYSNHSNIYSYGRKTYGNSINPENALKLVQVLLSFVLRELKNKSFYHGLFAHERIPAKDVLFLTPYKYKDAAFYFLLAKSDFSLVPEEKHSHGVFIQAFAGTNRMDVISLLKNEKFLAVLDNTLADAVVKHNPAYFKELPAEFQTAQRLLFTIESNPDYRYFYSLVEPKDEKLLTREVCRALIDRNRTLPDFPDSIWDEEMVNFCMENSRSFEWLEQMPQRFQTQEMVNRAVEYNPCNIRYVHKAFINSPLAMKVFRERSELKEFLPEKFLNGFVQATGLPEEFYGGETTFWRMREEKQNNTWCQIGNTFIGFQKNDRYRDTAAFVVMTRASSGDEQPLVVFNRRVGSFHKTWLEKMIADYDRDFVKPVVGKGLKDVQENIYCSVEPAGTKDGIEFFRSTFRGEAIGFTGRKGREIIRKETKEEVIAGFQSKEQEKEIAA